MRKKEVNLPIYSYECSSCGHVQEDLRSVENRLEPLCCPTCLGESTFILSTQSKEPDIYPYLDTFMDSSPVLITSLAHRRRELSKRGLQDAGGDGKSKRGKWYWKEGVRRMME